MHIVFVSREYVPTFRGGGIASYIKETAIGLVKKGHRVTVICASDDTNEESEYMDDGVSVIRLSGGDFVVSEKEYKSCLRKFRCLYRFYSYRKKILKRLKEIDNIDIVEVAEFGAEAFYLSKLHVPVVIRLHTPTLLDRNNAGMRPFSHKYFYDYWLGLQELKILPQFKYITSCSLSLKEWFKRYVPNLCANIEVVYNPIDVEQWINYDVNYEENTVLYVGTVAEGKGVGDLIEACHILRQEMNIPVTLKIVGKIGAYAMKLKQEVEANKYNWCIFLGNQPREKLKSLYAQSKVSCFPSWCENMPLVCLEAMLSGNIVVGSSNGGMNEIIEDGKDGYLIKPHDPRGLAICLRMALMENKESVSLKHKRAYNKIKNKFSMDVVLESLEKYYLNVKEQYEKSKSSMG